MQCILTVERNLNEEVVITALQRSVSAVSAGQNAERGKVEKLLEKRRIRINKYLEFRYTSKPGEIQTSILEKMILI